MPKINEHGFFEGGACHQRLRKRKSRAEGAWGAWNDLCAFDYVQRKGMWYTITAIQHERAHEDRTGNADWALGYLRMIQLVFRKLIGKKFKPAQMDIWIEAIASAEFMVTMESPLSIITPGEKVQMGICPPKPDDDMLYEKLYGVKSGLLVQKIKSSTYA